MSFKINKDTKNILFHLSGGTDSALLLYLTCKYITENNMKTTINPVTMVDEENPHNVKFVKKIIKLMKHFFVDVRLKSSKFEYGTKKQYNDNKRELLKNKIRKHLLSGKYDLTLNAITSLPELNELSKNIEMMKESKTRGAPIATEDRNKTLDKDEGPTFSKEFKCYYQRPFHNYDKRDIAKLYKEYNLMSSLFNITQSCVAGEEETKKGTIACKKCYWCLEKYWAFGLYDFEYK